MLADGSIWINSQRNPHMAPHPTYTGVRNRGVQTTTFRVHPRIRLAQLFQADGRGPLSPLRALIPPGHGISDVITNLKVCPPLLTCLLVVRRDPSGLA